jgi:SNF2 family DNA or RNA helicase
VEQGLWTALGSSQGDKDNEESRLDVDYLRKYGRHGTKVAHLLRLLQRIRSEDPSAKVLVYCQWDTLKLKLLNAFREFKVGCLSLEGNPMQLKNTLERFQDPQNLADFVLLCSLDRKAAGTNLQCASHVVFVHPFFARNQHRCRAWEAQAVGRSLRPGQTRAVHVYRFTMLQTIEQELRVHSAMSSGSVNSKSYFEITRPVR